MRHLADTLWAGLLLVLYVVWPIATVVGIAPSILVLTAGLVAGVLLIAEHVRVATDAKHQNLGGPQHREAQARAGIG